MTEAAGLICREGFAAWDLLRISGRVNAANIGSRRVLEKNGFQPEGILRQAFWKDGRVGDICLYGRLRNE